MSSSSEEEYERDPSLRDLLAKEELNWIFVGGKGGVGKTTTSCAIALLLAKRGKKVLLISTDPAHNISDALGQKINETPTPIKEVPNLSAMEIDPKKNVEEKFGFGEKSFINDIASSIPGIDEAISFAELMKQVKNMTHDIIVFDTAPTGHTLKFLGFPAVLEKGIAKMIQLKNRFSGIFNQFQSLMSANNKVKNTNGMLDKLEETKAVVEAVNEQFRNPNLTTFVCVCIPEFLSVHESSRLINALEGYKINCQALVVNQVLFPEKDSACKKCSSRVKMQRKYLMQINNLFDAFSIVTTPLLGEEVRGVEKIEEFAQFLLEPYQAA